MAIYCGKTEISPLILDQGIKKLLEPKDQIRLYGCVIVAGKRKDTGKEETFQIPFHQDLSPEIYFKSDPAIQEDMEAIYSPLERLNQLLKNPKNKGFKVSPQLMDYIKKEEGVWNRTRKKPTPDHKAGTSI